MGNLATVDVQAQGYRMNIKTNNVCFSGVLI